jgi:hypothetical protein
MPYTESDFNCLRALRSWMAKDKYTHALTLNSDRELSLAQIKKILSCFCKILDQRALDIRNLKLVPPDLRLRLIAFPENLTTNAHLHCFADFTAAKYCLGDETTLEAVVREAWHRANRGAGSIHLVPDPDYGWAKYITKSNFRKFFLSSEFFSP